MSDGLMNIGNGGLACIDPTNPLLGNDGVSQDEKLAMANVL
jgi:hypothetical protein